MSGGFLWKVSQHWNVGGVLRQGPQVDFDLEFHTGPAFDPATAPGTLIEAETGVLPIPGVLGLGVSYRTSDGDLTVGFEWDVVGYAALDEDLGNGNELHVGAEYVFLRSRPLTALRFGAWLDPNHRFTSDGKLIRPVSAKGAGDAAAGVGG